MRFPLLIYTTTLALLGLAHVVQELRYLRRRFGAWLLPAAAPLCSALGGIVLVRLVRWVGWVPRDVGMRLELAGAALVVLALVGWWRRSRASAGAGLGACLLLIGGLLIAPVHALLVVAVLHNWTPVPLIAEALPAPRRARFLWGALIGFGLLPALIATGVPWAVLGGDPQLRILPSGSLQANLSAYLPPEWIGTPLDQHLFSAIVFAQCLHYLSVIGGMPGLLPPAGGRWRWALGIGAATAILFVGYAADFRGARAAYGVIAAVHAWVEVPILVLLWLPVGPGVQAEAPSRS